MSQNELEFCSDEHNLSSDIQSFLDDRLCKYVQLNWVSTYSGSFLRNGHFSRPRQQIKPHPTSWQYPLMIYLARLNIGKSRLEASKLSAPHNVVMLSGRPQVCVTDDLTIIFKVEHDKFDIWLEKNSLSWMRYGVLNLTWKWNLCLESSIVNILICSNQW